MNALLGQHFPTNALKQIWLASLLISTAIDTQTALPLDSGDSYHDNSYVDGNFSTFDKQFKTFDDTTIKITQRQRSPSAEAFTLDTEADSSNLTVEIRAFGFTFQLELTLNKYLVHPLYYIEKAITINGLVQYFENATTTTTNCYYIGHVVNYPDSAAAAATCSGFRAQISTNGDLYHVEPVDGTIEGRHRVYRESDSLLPKTSCGDGDEHNSSNVMKTLHNLVKQRTKRDTLNWPRDLYGKTKVVELYVANDYSQYISQGRSTAKVFSRTKEIYNFASSLYQPLDIYITLVGVEVWTTGSLIPITQYDPVLTLGNFSQYRENKINPIHKNDNAQLLATTLYPGGVIGLAWIGTMCAVDSSAAIVTEYSSAPGFTTAVAVHEMGHNFGMSHDNQLAPITCACNDPTTYCIMNSFASLPPSTRWSNCSTSTMSSFISSPASTCLYDFNGVLFDITPVCGNGIVESGEQCDCGNAPSSECNPNCCNATTCKLISTAKCSDGLCCDIPSCQLKPITTVCRAAKNSCDLSEYCSGINNTCPSDVYKQNGISCTVAGVSAYCYAGLCRSRSTQCQLWWGPSINASDDRCYTGFNTHGQEYGNCGIVDQIAGIYQPCSSSDALCGTLHCDVGENIQPNIQLSGQIRWYNGKINNIYDCAIPIAPPRYVIPNLGMVPDGTACGATNMCLNHSCISVASVMSQAPCVSCGQHGVCNSISQCHCEIGFGPPDCSQPGNGGSYHSNPIEILTTTKTLTTTIRTTTSSTSTLITKTATSIPSTIQKSAAMVTVVTNSSTNSAIALTTRIVSATAQTSTAATSSRPTLGTTQAASASVPATTLLTTTSRSSSNPATSPVTTQTVPATTQTSTAATSSRPTLGTTQAASASVPVTSLSTGIGIAETNVWSSPEVNTVSAQRVATANTVTTDSQQSWVSSAMTTFSTDVSQNTAFALMAVGSVAAAVVTAFTALAVFVRSNQSAAAAAANADQTGPLTESSSPTVNMVGAARPVAATSTMDQLVGLSRYGNRWTSVTPPVPVASSSVNRVWVNHSGHVFPAHHRGLYAYDFRDPTKLKSIWSSTN